MTTIQGTAMICLQAAACCELGLILYILFDMWMEK